MKRRLFKAKRIAALAGAVAIMSLFFGCSSDNSYTAYSRYRASFTYYTVMTTTPLKNALTSPGEYCAISLTANRKLNFVSPTLSQQVDVTASAVYQSYTCVGGFIAGMSNMPEMGADTQGLVAYDLVCANCYRNDAIQRALTLHEGGKAYCQRCKRTYDLNSKGIVSSGDKGRPLERYHIAYDGNNRMSIWN